jgi:hypothetical protein
MNDRYVHDPCICEASRRPAGTLTILDMLGQVDGNHVRAFVRR